MSGFTNILLSIASGAAYSAEDLEIEAALQVEHDKNPTQYAAELRGEVAAIALLKPVIANVKSKFVAGLITTFDTAFQNSAKTNGITL